jgi:hypothetical protein
MLFRQFNVLLKRWKKQDISQLLPRVFAFPKKISEPFHSKSAVKLQQVSVEIGLN